MGIVFFVLVVEVLTGVIIVVEVFVVWRVGLVGWLCRLGGLRCLWWL